jgi:hypothetical protein
MAGEEATDTRTQAMKFEISHIDIGSSGDCQDKIPMDIKNQDETTLELSTTESEASKDFNETNDYGHYLLTCREGNHQTIQTPDIEEINIVLNDKEQAGDRINRDDSSNTESSRTFAIISSIDRLREEISRVLADDSEGGSGTSEEKEEDDDKAKGPRTSFDIASIDRLRQEISEALTDDPKGDIIHKESGAREEDEEDGDETKAPQFFDLASFKKMTREIDGASGEPSDGGSSSGESHVSEEKEENGDETKAPQFFDLASFKKMTREIAGASTGEPSDGGSSSGESLVSEEKEEDGDETKAPQFFDLASFKKMTREIGGTSTSEGESSSSKSSVSEEREQDGDSNNKDGTQAKKPMFDVAAFKMMAQEINGTVSSSDDSTDCDSEEEKDQFPMNDDISISEGEEDPPPPPPFPPVLFREFSLGDSKNVFTSPSASHKSFTSPSASHKSFTSPHASHKSFTSPSASHKSARQLNSPGSSFSNLDDDSLRGISTSLVVKQQLSEQGVRFADTVDEKDISRLHQSAIEGLFYSDEDFATFRYTAFMEDCGLDPNDFD